MWTYDQGQTCSHLPQALEEPPAVVFVDKQMIIDDTGLRLKVATQVKLSTMQRNALA
jgi:hypothetical protein